MVPAEVHRGRDGYEENRIGIPHCGIEIGMALILLTCVAFVILRRWIHIFVRKRK